MTHEPSWRNEPFPHGQHANASGRAFVGPKLTIVASIALACLANVQPTFGDDQRLDEAVPLVRWSGVPMRRVLERANEGLELGVLLDRRLDPSRHVDLELRDTTNRGVFEALAKDAGGELRIVGETIYIGPGASAPLRTLIHLREEEYRKRWPTKNGPARRTFAWDNFATPRDVLTRLADEYGPAIEGVDTIPHDLWAAVELPEAPFVEAVSLVLIQFDRTFEWSENGDGIRIVPVPEAVGYERLHAPKGESAAELAAFLEKQFPESRVEVAGRRVRLFALHEAHEAAEAGPAGRAQAPMRGETSSLDQQRFTLRVAGVPASAVMKRLEQTGLTFEYDPKALAAADVDLDQRIDLDVKDATTTELLKAVFEPLKLDVTLDGTTVRLRART